MRRTVLFLTAVTSAASLTGTWTESLEFCKRFEQGPASINDKLNPGTWIGRAIYKFEQGDVFLQIETVNEAKTCYDCDGRNNKDDCEYCVLRNLPSQLNAIQDFIWCLEPNRMFIVGNFTYFTDIGELPEPTLCLVSNGQYDSCEKSFQDGCNQPASPLKVIVHTNKSLETSLCWNITTSKNESSPRRGHLLLHVIFVLMCMSLQIWENGVNTL